MNVAKAPTQVLSGLGLQRLPGAPTIGLGSTGKAIFPGYRCDQLDLFAAPFVGKMLAPAVDPDALAALCGKERRA